VDGGRGEASSQELPQQEIPRQALPNDLTCPQLRLRPGPDGVSQSVEPGQAGWRYLSFRVLALASHQDALVGLAGHEACLVVIAGGGLGVETEAGTIDLPGRADPFDQLPWALYLPPGFRVRIAARPTDEDGRVVVAVAEAPPTGRAGVAAAPRVISPDDVAIEVRGAGNATRQINHIITPDFPADRLEVVEVLTPSGNWSSWPPHKHDVDDPPREAVLEEVYYYWFRRPTAWGIQRLYRADRSRDCLWEVRRGDLVLVTDGYHPFAAAHGDDAYYLNALAGDRRTMACSFDPDLDWVRERWRELPTDPRVPLVGRSTAQPAGRRG
jgi:5-deoxy-glucuronate isomerase